MARALQLAKNGLGSAAPNPAVGAVIVYDKKIIGEGFTSSYGGPHAEVNAIRAVMDTSLLKRATLYVTLEPCSHFGKTPPCADLIVNYGIPRVVIGLSDPHKKVAGNGIQKLKNADCEVILGVLEKECRAHHKRFLTFHENKRPHITLKWAQTLDGFLAPEADLRSNIQEPYWITGPTSRQLVHQWRAQEQAILVGTNTVLHDNPKLNVRHWKGKNPVRIVLDRSLKINGDYHVLDGSIPTLILTEVIETSKYLKGIEYQYLDFSKDLARQICTILWQRNLMSILIEGGSKTLQTFIDEGLWDDALVFTGNTSFTNGISAPILSKDSVSIRTIGQDTLNFYKND